MSKGQSGPTAKQRSHYLKCNWHAEASLSGKQRNELDASQLCTSPSLNLLQCVSKGFVFKRIKTPSQMDVAPMVLKVGLGRMDGSPGGVKYRAPTVLIKAFFVQERRLNLG